MSIDTQFGDAGTVKREIESEYDVSYETSDEETKATVSLMGCLDP